MALLLVANAVVAGAEAPSGITTIIPLRNWLQGTVGYAERQRDFDDSTWRTVTLPRDNAISQAFITTAGQEYGDPYAGQLPWKIAGAMYRCHFRLEPEQRDRAIYLIVENAVPGVSVSCNEAEGKMAPCPSGFGAKPGMRWFNLTKAVQFGNVAKPRKSKPKPAPGADDPDAALDELDGTVDIPPDGTESAAPAPNNVLVLSAGHYQRRFANTPWYPGSGITGAVYLLILDPLHIGLDGPWVTTPVIEPGRARVSVRTPVWNQRNESMRGITLRTTILAPDGKTVAQVQTPLDISAGGSVDAEQQLDVPNPLLWSPDTPHLYTIVSDLVLDGTVCDRQQTPFGIRSLQWTADDGFHLNGKRVDIKGVELPIDCGPLGVRVYPRAWERRLELMKAMGANAVRFLHGPPPAVALDACDRLGMLVVYDLFTNWDDTAGYNQYTMQLPDFMTRTVPPIVRQARNAPSVIAWSIGQDVVSSLFTTPDKGKSIINHTLALVRATDASRPVTLACSDLKVLSPDVLSLDGFDLQTWNYAGSYTLARKRFPNTPLLYGETGSTVSTRGYYAVPLPAGRTLSSAPQVTAYDRCIGEKWGDIPDVDFLRMASDRYCAGQFVRSGFDELGARSPFSKSAISSYCGIMDYVGLPKDRYWLYRSVWAPDTATVHILPHWNWPGQEGKPIPVYVYTNGEEAELFLNGKSLGRRTKVAGEPPRNLALGKPATASSTLAGDDRSAGRVCDGDVESGWLSASPQAGAWWQLDLGAVQTLKLCRVRFLLPAYRYAYTLQVSDDGVTWRTAVVKPKGEGTTTVMDHVIAVQGRYVRLVFPEYGMASLNEIELYDRADVADYYAVMRRYRLIWDNVPYQPGELKAVAYVGGKPIGTATVCTAGAPARLTLTPDRPVLAADGQDLSHITVEMLDAQGNRCPLANNMIKLRVTGPGDIAGIGNGDPLCIDPFQDDKHPLFHGQAVLIINSRIAQVGPVTIRATAGEGITAAEITLQCK